MNLRRVYVEIVMTLMFVKEFAENVLRFVNMGRNRYTKNSQMDGKVVVITGANTGIGKETAHQLAMRGAKIIMCCRDLSKGQAAAADIMANNSRAVLHVMELNLSSLASVRQFARQLAQREPRIDVLINNAGVMMCPPMTTDDGFEMQFGTNHLGHFLLTLLLLDQMKTSSDARVITISSMHAMRGRIHFDDIDMRHNYSPLEAYCQSKLANIHFSRELGRRLAARQCLNIKTYAVHPGTVRSDLFRHLSGPTSMVYKTIGLLFNIDVNLGVQTTLHCSLDTDAGHESGFYYSNCRKRQCLLREATDETVGHRLWQLSERLVQLDDKYRL